MARSKSPVGKKSGKRGNSGEPRSNSSTPRRGRKKRDDEGVPLTSSKTKDYHTVQVRDSEPEHGRGNGCCCPFFHLFWLAIMVVGIVFLAIGMHDAISDLNNTAFKWGVAVISLPAVFALIQLILACCETGSSVSSVAHSGCCSCFTWVLEWICIFQNYFMLIIVSITLGLMTLSTAAAYLVSAVCEGGQDGKRALCPVLYMTRQKADFDWDDAVLCSCNSTVSVSNGAACATGWQIGSKFNDLCENSELVKGSEYANLGLLILNAGMIGMLAMSMRSRTRMDIKRAQEF